MQLIGNSASGDRRDNGRRRVYLGADIVIGAGFSPADCLLKKIKQSGAKIFANERIMPLCLALRVHKTGTQHNARIVWRRGQEIGVSFRADETGS
jgi:hypothetical protein